MNELARRHKVHLACFARTPQELEEARKLVDRCASVYVAPLFPFSLHITGAGLRFAAGACLNTAFYDSRAMRSDIAALMSQRKMDGAVSYTAVMAPYVPEGLPFVLDLTDVDSEKWYQYGQERKPGFLFRGEAGRIRQLERAQASRARLTLLTTGAEETLFRSFAPQARTAVMENGVDFGYFDPEKVGDELGLSARKYVAFVGSMDYYPTQQAVIEFVERVFPALRAREPELELLIVGRRPSPKVMALAREPGVELVGSVDDVRPYYRWARGTVAPLGIARGIQNKVLEALAMDKPVWASEAVCRTFGKHLPEGVKSCSAAEDYGQPSEAAAIRKKAMARFSWRTNLSVLTEAVEHIGRGR